MAWDSTDQHHAYRLKDEADFRKDSFSVMTLKKKSPKVHARLGKLLNQKTRAVQSLLFPKSEGWTLDKAKSWVKENYDKSAAGTGETLTIPLEGLSITVPIQQLVCQLEASPNEPAGGGLRKRVTWYTGASVVRSNWGEKWMLTLDMSPKSVRMDRLNKGAPVLDSHQSYELRSQLGVVEKAWIDKGKGFADLLFSERDEVKPIVNDIKAGIIRNASVGCMIHTLKDVSEDVDAKVKSYLATDWEPMEISIVPMGADMDAGFSASLAADPRSSEAQVLFEEVLFETLGVSDPASKEPMNEQQLNPGGVAPTNQPAAAAPAAIVAAPAALDENKLRADAIAAERVRASGIRLTARTLRVEEAFAEQHIGSGTSLDDFRKLAIDNLAEKAGQPPQISANLDVTRDVADTRRAAMVLALMNRADAGQFKLDEPAREYAHFSLLELAKACLTAANVRHRGLDKSAIAKLAFETTSDFPYILADVLNKNLRAGYQLQDTQSQWKLISSRRTSPDFRANYEIQLDSQTRMSQVNEHGEFPYGDLKDSQETWKLVTYGEIVALTRQTIINDDLGAFTRTPMLLGQEVAVLEATTVWAILTANAALTDGNDLFSAAHGNVDTGQAISVASIGTALALMMKQTSLGGKILNITPRYIVVPVALYTLAMQFTSAAYLPDQPAYINPFGGRLTPIPEARLDVASATHWYLFADPNLAPVLVHGYLEGQEGPYTETRQGFHIDGIEIKIRLDFGAGAIDFRGAVQDPD